MIAVDVISLKDNALSPLLPSGLFYQQQQPSLLPVSHSLASQLDKTGDQRIFWVLKLCKAKTYRIHPYALPGNCLPPLQKEPGSLY